MSDHDVELIAAEERGRLKGKQELYIEMYDRIRRCTTATEFVFELGEMFGVFMTDHPEIDDVTPEKP